MSETTRCSPLGRRPRALISAFGVVQWVTGSETVNKSNAASREEAQSERKKGSKSKRKGKQRVDTKNSPSVNAVIEEAPPDPSSSTPHVNSASNDAIVFYAGCETRWMLDSGCLDHIAHELSDFNQYKRLPNPLFVRLADSTTRISYLGTGTVITRVDINSSNKMILLRNVLHLLSD